MLAGKRHTLAFLHVADNNNNRYRYHDDLSDNNDDDAIPLVSLSPHSPTIQQRPAPVKQQHKRRDRMYRYVSHGIGGAGNFRRKVLTSFRSDVTTTRADDPSVPARVLDAADVTPSATRTGGDGGGGGGVCACSRCWSRKTTPTTIP